MPYQLMFEADFVEHRHRGKTFFRWLLAIPQLLWASIWGSVVHVVVIVAWFALLFTGRYPAGLYEFVADYLRYLGRAMGYVTLMTDSYPPFGGEENPGYPVRVAIAPPLEEYGRWRTLLRLPIMVLALPVVYVGYALLLGLYAAATAPYLHWLVIINDGRARPSLHRLTWMAVAFSLRAYAWIFLLTPELPPFFSEWPRTAASGPSSAPAPATA